MNRKDETGRPSRPLDGGSGPNGPDGGVIEPEDLDVRKPRARLRRFGTAQSRRTILATAELLGGVSSASAEAFKSLSASLTSEDVASVGLGASLFNGIRDGNSRFFEELSRTSRKAFDALRPADKADEALMGPESVARRLDYDRLADLVAARMGNQPPPSAA
jgi:hypothetical protein